MSYTSTGAKHIINMLHCCTLAHIQQPPFSSLLFPPANPSLTLLPLTQLTHPYKCEGVWVFDLAPHHVVKAVGLGVVFVPVGPHTQPPLPVKTR